MNIDMLASFRECWEKIEEVGNQYAEAKGQSWQSQELKGSVLASIIKKYPSLPVSKAEIEGRSSEDYQTYIKETAKAITKELKLKAQLEKWKAKFESMRSLSSLEKAQINSEGH